jgi:hypothetical protein
VALLLGHLRGDNGPLHQRTPRDDDHIGTVAALHGFAERNHVVRSRVLPFVVRLPVEMFVLEKHHRVIAPDGRAQQAGRVLRRRRECDAQAGAMREDALA